MVGPLVTTDWLAAHLGEPDLRVVDGSWHLPRLERDARKEWAEAHIPGAPFFDIDEIADKRTSLPHMLPRPEEFGRAVGALGSGDLPYDTLYRPDGTLHSTDQLRRTLERAGIDLARPVVTTCGSGVTASVLAFALHLVGCPETAVYDGSWSEWGGREDTPVSTRPPRSASTRSRPTPTA